MGRSKVAPVCAGLTLLLLVTLGACGDDAADTPPPTAEPTAQPVEPTPTPTWVAVATARITTDDLNVRSGPGTGEAVVGRLQPGDEVPVSGRWQGGQWLALPGIGWTAYNAEWQELNVEYRSLPVVPDAAKNFAFTGPVHPPDVRVGIPVVDQLVDAIVSGDRRALAVLAQPPGATATPGPASDPSAPCVDGILPASRLAEKLDALHTSQVVTGAAGQALRLYGVVRGPVRQDGSSDYVVVFAFDRGEGRQFWVAPGGHITQFSLGCSPTLPGSMLRVTPGEPFFWFRPPLPPPLHPVP
jgi:hypothetical protein